MADDESLKMATLKKAYAEIILNTSKEAAARIMMADRKALSFEKELFALKQDALHMLVQLKQTLDSKNAEAENRSANQQRRIEELEAQLSEAEGIIVDLREDLRHSQAKLEKLGSNLKQPLLKHTSENCKDHQLISENEMIAQTYDRSYQAVEYLSSGNECRAKNPAEIALHCTFRDQLVRSAHCDASLDRYHGVKSGRERCSSCSSESDEKDTKSTCNGSEAKSLVYESHYIQAARDGFRRTRKNDKYQEAIATLRSCSRGRRARSCQPPSFPQCRTYSGKQNEASIKVPDNSGISPRPDSCCVTSSFEMNHNSDTAQEKSKEIREKSRCMKKESYATVKELDLSFDVDPFRLKPSLVDSEGISNRADGDKVLKYTFQRKRKKEVLTKLDNNITPEQGHAVKLQKTIVNDEHAMDSKQLLQVAQQLIALSGNGPSS